MDVSGSQIQFIDISIHLVWMSYDSITLRHQLVCGTNPDWRRGEIPSQHRNRPGTWRPATTPWRIERRPASGCPLRRAFWSMRPHRGSLQSVRGGTRFDGIRCRGAGENALGESMSLCKHSEGISTSTCHFWILWQSFIAKKRKGIHSTFFMWMGVSNHGGLHPIVGSWDIWDQQWELSSTFDPSAPTFGSFNRSIFDMFGNFLKHWKKDMPLLPSIFLCACSFNHYANHINQTELQNYILDFYENHFPSNPHRNFSMSGIVTIIPKVTHMHINEAYEHG